MVEISAFHAALWGFIAFSKVTVLVLLFYRRNHKIFPAFSAYIFTTLMQDTILILSYYVWGFRSPASVRIAWGSQILVIVFRGLAVAEVCHRLLARYTGIWGLAWRLLLASVALLLLYAVVTAGLHPQLVLLTADRGLELTIAIAILILFLFVYYYAVPMEFAVRDLAIGFFFFSWFSVVNYLLLEVWRYRYGRLWSLLSMSAFLASLLLWIWALRDKLPDSAPGPEMLCDGIYSQLVPEINLRLRALNDSLSKFWTRG
jgi:hypothetical protein